MKKKAMPKPFKANTKPAKTEKKSSEDIPDSFLFLAAKEVKVRELMNELKTAFDYEIEVWDDAGILEIIVEEKASIDVEEFSINPRDELLVEVAGKAGAKSAFCFAAPTEIFGDTKKVLLHLKEAIGGAVVGDTADLKPEL